MIYSLEAHDRNYNISCNDSCQMALGFTGYPYAYRHLELADNGNPENALGHRIIAGFQLVPIFGVLMAIAERIIYVCITIFFNLVTANQQPNQNIAANQRPNQDITSIIASIPQNVPRQHVKWKARNLPIDVAMRKMRKNALKAINEHRTKAPDQPYISPDSLPSIDVLNSRRPLPPLRFTVCSAERQGTRATMEDARIYKELEEGVLVGILDGHGGKEVAAHAAPLIESRFSILLRETNGNVHQAFERLCEEVQQSVIDNRFRSGSTAVLSFIDKRTHLIYTATLADSEANIYRKNQAGVTESIPLSCVRDWSSAKENDRAYFLGTPVINFGMEGNRNPKVLRVNSINVSRAFGDLGTPAISQKPKITVYMVQPDDELVWACDGLKDFASERQIIYKLDGDYIQNPADRLADAAINEWRSSDNVTVIHLKIS